MNAGREQQARAGLGAFDHDHRHQPRLADGAHPGAEPEALGAAGGDVVHVQPIDDGDTIEAAGGFGGGQRWRCDQQGKRSQSQAHQDSPGAVAKMRRAWMRSGATRSPSAA